MATTPKFGLPLVQTGDTIQARHWNDAYNIIDTLCIGSNIIVEDYALNLSPTTGEATLENTDAQNMKFLQIIPARPSNEEQYKAIAMSSIQVYVEGTTIHFKALGVIPSIPLYITILGWY